MFNAAAATHISAALQRIPRSTAAPQDCTQQAPQQQPEDIPEDTPEERAIKRLFMLMHGRYGKPWLEKWSTGEMTQDGKDKGVLSAMRIWRVELTAQFSAELLREAADKWKTTEQGRKWAPSLPEFEALCGDLQQQHAAAAAFKAAAKPQAHRDYIEASPEAIAAHKKAVRELALARMHASLAERDGAVATSEGLPGLLHLVARATALAGGDEARKLAQLERSVFGPSIKARAAA